ncbi:MAG: hypothetical protein H6R00_21 [Proteobacteria bacterium]|nr:hypothetical protein [Pseudomonadota bacterium]
MKPYYALPLGFVAAVALPTLALAKPVTVTAQFADYGGYGLYAAVYITDPQGKVVQTLHVAGSRAKYYRHLSGWARGARGPIDGLTGASIGSGGRLKVTAEVADAMLDAGYKVQVDTAIEGGNEFAADAAAPLSAASAGKPAPGNGYVQSLTVSY